jgi:hypothetical protein
MIVIYIHYAATGVLGIWVWVFGLPLERSVPFHAVCGFTSLVAMIIHLGLVWYVFVGLLKFPPSYIISPEQNQYGVTPLYGLVAFLS